MHNWTSCEQNVHINYIDGSYSCSNRTDKLCENIIMSDYFAHANCSQSPHLPPLPTIPHKSKDKWMLSECHDRSELLFTSFSWERHEISQDFMLLMLLCPCCALSSKWWHWHFLRQSSESTLFLSTFAHLFFSSIITSIFPPLQFLIFKLSFFIFFHALESCDWQYFLCMELQASSYPPFLVS